MFNDAIWEHIDRFTKAKKTSDIQQQLERFSHQMGWVCFRPRKTTGSWVR